jgi:excisionase family DNA binding protein
LEEGFVILARLLARALSRHDIALKYMDISKDAVELLLKPAKGKEKLVLSVAETSEIMGISKNTVYELIRQKKLPSITFGKRILVPKVRLIEALNQIGVSD